MPDSFDNTYTPPRAAIDPDTSKGWFRRLLPLLLGYKGLIAIILPASFLTAGAGVLVPYYVATAVQVAIERQEASVGKRIHLAVALLVAPGSRVLLG